MYLASAFEKQSQHGRALNLLSFYNNSEGWGALVAVAKAFRSFRSLWENGLGT